MTVRTLACLLASSIGLALVPAHPASAQHVDLHGTYVTGRDEQQALSGIGVGVRRLFNIPYSYLGVRVGEEYARERGDGARRLATSLDLTLTPGLELPVLLYAGGGVSANRTVGQQRAWKGYRPGLDALVGGLVPLPGADMIGLQLEGRYGYIAQLPHVFAARAGLAVDF